MVNMSIEHFLVEDLDGSIIQINYLTDNPSQFWLTMKQDIVNDVVDINDKSFENWHDISYKEDQIINNDDYCDITLRVFKEMSITFNELPWNPQEIMIYNEFLDILLESGMIEYNKSGVPIFINSN